MRLTVVSEVGVIRNQVGSSRHRHLLRGHHQCAVSRGHVVQRRHILCAVGDGVALDGVVNRGGGNVLDLALKLHLQHIAVLQLNLGVTIVHPHFSLRIRTQLHQNTVDTVHIAVIDPATGTSRDGQVGGGSRHRQLTRCQRDVVVALVGESPTSRIHRGGHRALARIGDAAVDGETAN